MSPVSAPVPLLLVADSASTCERIASALLSAPAFYRIERITSTDFAAKGAPGGIRLALVDSDLKAARQVQVVQQLQTHQIACVALADASNIQGLQEIVLAGVAGLVVMPFEDALLWQTIGTALARGVGSAPAPAADSSAARSTQGIIIAIHAPKSGSGASVIAANLAITLQARSRRGAVLVEGGEGAACQALLLNLRTERTMGDLLARFDPDDHDLLNEVLTVHASGLRTLLAAPSKSLRIPPDTLEDILTILQDKFDYIIVDLHASTVASMTVALRKANALFVIIVPEMTSLHTVKQFVETMTATLPEVGLNIVLNRATLPGGVPTEAIRRHLRLQIAVELPDEQELVTTSVNRGVPFVIGHPRSGLAKAINVLADELAPGRGEARDAGKSGLTKSMSPLGRLLNRGRAR